MARVAGIDLPKEKRIDVALQYVYGVGPRVSKEVLTKASIDPTTRVKELSEGQVGQLNTLLTKEYKVEGELRREVQAHLRHFIEINSYRGLRHRRNLPARGQRTKTNARTRRGRRRTVGSGKATAKPTGK
jgi:small subunit ribosomal protein S13